MATYTLHAVHPFLFLIFPARGPLSLACMFISSSQENASNDIERTLFGPGAADLELEMYVLLAYFLLSRNREKIKFGGIRALRDYHTRGETTEESTFCITIGL